MPSRIVDLLIQTDPRGASGPQEVLRQSFSFDIGRVSAAGMKELIETCNTGGPMAPLIEALLTSGDGQPLEWRENGPGVGWEMRTAWSGIFGRFFARAFLEEQGYTWFHSIRRSYDRATDDLVVVRAGSGEVADWVCARDQDALDEGEFIVAEAKARHRHGTLDLANLPKSLARALEQIDNTFVFFRGVGGLEFRRTKGMAVLLKWANEEKTNSKPILRAVDPQTSGLPFSPDDRVRVVHQLARAQIADLLNGLGFPVLAGRINAARRIWDPAEARQILERVRQVIVGRSESAEDSPETQWLNREEWLGRKRPGQYIEWLTRSLEKESNFFPLIAKVEPQTSMTGDEVRREALRPVPTVRIQAVGLDRERFIGSVFGLAGRVAMPMRDLVRSLSSIPSEIARQMVFVGIRVSAAEEAVAGRPIEKWRISDSVRRNSERQSVYASPDNVMVAPASLLEIARAKRIIS